MITQFFVINNNITFILPHSVQHSEYRIEGMGGKKSTADSDYKIIEDTWKNNLHSYILFIKTTRHKQVLPGNNHYVTVMK